MAWPGYCAPTLDIVATLLCLPAVPFNTPAVSVVPLAHKYSLLHSYLEMGHLSSTFHSHDVLMTFW